MSSLAIPCGQKLYNTFRTKARLQLASSVQTDTGSYTCTCTSLLQFHTQFHKVLKMNA